MKRLIFGWIIIGIYTTSCFAETSITVLAIHGCSQIRHGMNEKWEPAQVGQVLRKMDSIVTGPGTTVTILRADGFKTTIPEKCLLDIFELEPVSEQDLILFLTGEKLREMQPLREKPDLKLSPVHIIHGEKYEIPATDSILFNTQIAELEMNGVRMLLQIKYFANAIIKLNKIKRIFGNKIDMPEAEFQEAVCFESIQFLGNALAIYEKIIKSFPQTQYSQIAEARILEIRQVYLAR
jgi:hypothetical protein